MTSENISGNRRSLLRNGFAALSDLQSAEWRELYERLDRDQLAFLAKQAAFRSPEYKWPRDALHHWSRVWEYPYAFRSLQEIRTQSAESRMLRVIDFGSGVTFFPFSTARLGYDVTCIDIDPVCAHDIPAAAKVIDASPGAVQVQLLQQGGIGLPDCTQDAVYCISVLEHIPDFVTTIREISRVLKPAGYFVLTCDVDFRGDFELGIDNFYQLLESLSEFFEPVYQDAVVHPRDLLTTSNSSIPLFGPSRRSRIKRYLSRFFTTQRRPLSGDPRALLDLTAYAGIYRRTAS